MPAAMPTVDIENVSKTLRSRSETFRMERVSFQVKRGEVFGLLGPNGAGKTTILNMVVGILLPDEGTIRVFGSDVQRDRDVLERVGFGSGETRFHWGLRTKDILGFYGRIYGMEARRRNDRIAELVAFFGLTDVLNRKFGYLSTGERMRLVFAKALLNEPQLLLLDEPTLGLDPEIALRVREEVRRINRTFNTTILLTSHYMQEVEQLADRIGFIHRGRLIDIGTIRQVKLRHFTTYDLTIKVKSVKDVPFLKRRGFFVRGTTLKKTMHADEDISAILAELVARGFCILDVESRKPTLEDYFVKMTGERHEIL